MNWKKLLLPGGIFGFFASFLLAVTAFGLWWDRYGRPPEQPIAFPHSIHAGKLSMSCLFCHDTADKSPLAGAPPLERCAGCHRSIAADRPGVKKLLSHLEEKRPLHWVRVHELPDFVYFSHRPHVLAGLDCAACHGDLSAMERVRQVRPLSMGWCVSCHRANDASMDCATCHK